MNNKRKALVEYLVSVGGKKNSELSWSEILMMFEEKVNIKNIKKASDFWRYYQKTGKIVPESEANELTERTTLKVPKMLLYDLETSPKKAYIWRMWQENINATNGMLQSDSFILTFSAKWVGSDKMITHKLTPKEVLAEDDSRIVNELWNLLDEADVLIGHNIKKYDNKVAQTRFLLNGLIKPSTSRSIDTLVQARKHFKLPSNRLDYIGQALGLGAKVETGGFKLWERVMSGEQKAIDEMAHYCDGDIILTEAVYYALRPFITSHPNVANLIDKEGDCCPTCASTDITTNGNHRTNTNMYITVKCNSCGAQSRERSTITAKNPKLGLIPLSI